MPPALRFVLMSSTEFGLPLLTALLEHAVPGAELVGVVTTPPKAAGRGLKLTPSPIAQALAELSPDLPVMAPENLTNNPDLERSLTRLAPDGLVVASYGKIIPRWILELVPWPLGIHPSLLPKLRGPSPVRTAVLLGLTETGITVFVMDQKVDHGPILTQRKTPLGRDETYGNLLMRLARLGVEVFAEAVSLISSSVARPVSQQEEEATYTRKFTRRDTYLDFSRPRQQVHNLVRAMNPDLGAAARFRSGLLKIWRTKLCEQPPERELSPGELLVVGKQRLLVGCGDGPLEVLEVQPESRNRMPAQSFINGFQPAPGERLEKIVPS